jgi:hypothetical protein
VRRSRCGDLRNQELGPLNGENGRGRLTRRHLAHELKLRQHYATTVSESPFWGQITGFLGKPGLGKAMSRGCPAAYCGFCEAAG